MTNHHPKPPGARETGRATSTRVFLVGLAALVGACTDQQTNSIPTGPDLNLVGAQQPAPVFYNPMQDPSDPNLRRFVVVFDDALPDPAALTDQIVTSFGLTPRFRFEGPLKGFSAELSADAIEAIRRIAGVKRIWQNARGELFATQSNAPWGLDRIDQRTLPLNGLYTYFTQAPSVHVYIHDTGIRTTHTQFGGRVDIANSWDIFTYNHPGVPQIIDDCHGHGTAVAAIVGGSRYGVAKGVRLHSVQVAECSGGSYTLYSENVAAGLNLMQQFLQLPAVANLSLGFDTSLWYVGGMEDEINRALARGVTVVTAAPNEEIDACRYSPARMSASSAVITVSMSDRSDFKPFSAGIGPCVSLFAPGAEIPSAWRLSDSDTTVVFGTSYATPHVTGAAALYLQDHPGDTPATVRSRILGVATSGALGYIGTGSPNLLLYTLFVRDSIRGPSSFNAGSSATYLSTTQYGKSPYTWQWYENGYPTCTTSSCQIFGDEAGTIDVELLTTDATGNTFTAFRSVRVTCPSGAKVC